MLLDHFCFCFYFIKRANFKLFLILKTVFCFYVMSNSTSSNVPPTVPPDVGNFLQSLMTLNWQGKQENRVLQRGNHFYKKKHEAESGMHRWVPEAECGRYYHQVQNHEAECGVKDSILTAQRELFLAGNMGKWPNHRGRGRGNRNFRGRGRGSAVRGGNASTNRGYNQTTWGGMPEPEPREKLPTKKKDEWTFTVNGGEKRNAEDDDVAMEGQNPGMRPKKARRIIIPDYSMIFAGDVLRFSTWKEYEPADIYLMEGKQWPSQYDGKSWSFHLLIDATSYQVTKMAKHLNIDTKNIWPCCPDPKKLRANDRIFAIRLTNDYDFSKIISFGSQILHGSDAFKKVKFAPLLTASWILNDGKWYYNPPGHIKLETFFVKTLKQNQWLMTHMDLWVMHKDGSDKKTLAEIVSFKQAKHSWGLATDTQLARHRANCVEYAENYKKVSGNQVTANGKTTFLHQKLRILYDEENGKLSDDEYSSFLANKLSKIEALPTFMVKKSGLTVDERVSKEKYLQQQRDGRFKCTIG